MTVQVHPVETEESPQQKKQKLTEERKKSDANLISLWDERADVGGIVRSRNRRNDEKGG
jgi:hypothetical protein